MTSVRVEGLPSAQAARSPLHSLQESPVRELRPSRSSDNETTASVITLAGTGVDANAGPTGATGPSGASGPPALPAELTGSSR